MSKRTLSVILCCAGALAGCGGGGAPVASSAPAVSNLHGGVLIPLPENQAFVELLNGKREKKGQVSETTIVAYVLQADQQSAVSPAPTEVVVKLDNNQGSSEVPLAAVPDSADPVGSARFMSKPGNFELNQRGGEVSVTLAGKTLKAAFRGPR